MIRIQDISRSYSKVQVSFTKKKTTYAPCLHLFGEKHWKPKIDMGRIPALLSEETENNVDSSPIK